MTIDASTLRVSVQEQARWRRRMRVTVPSSVVREEERKATRSVASRMKVKGFRKGKVPSNLVSSRLGAALRKETVDRIIRDAYRHALRLEALRPISEGELHELEYEPDAGSDLVFSIDFDVEPTVELARLGGFTVVRPRLEVGEGDVTDTLERLRRARGVWRTAETGCPADGDLVNVRLERLDERGGEQTKTYELTLGRGEAIPDVEEAIARLEPGASGTFTVTFPPDSPDESKRGVRDDVTISLLERKVLELPELDDAFARDVGDFEDVEALRSAVRSDLEREASERAEAVVRGRLLDSLLEANAFDVPRSMVERYVDAIVGDAAEVDAEKLAEVRERLAPEAERAVKRSLVVERVARTQNLEASGDEVDRRVEEIARGNDTTAAKVYASLQKAGRIEALEREITERKVFEFLKERSTITEEPAG